MKIRSKHLAKALFELTKRGDTGVEEKFLSFMKDKNMLSLIPQVLYRLEKLIERDNEKMGIKIEVAHPIKEETVLDIKKFLQANSLREYTKINKNLLAGFRASWKGVVYDASFSTKLKKLEETIIN